MRWTYKPKTDIDRIKKRFALFPVIVGNEWVWLETYYSYTIEGYAGPETSRFSTLEEAIDWLNNWEE
jgi:hypothetical protein